MKYTRFITKKYPYKKAIFVRKGGGFINYVSPTIYKYDEEYFDLDVDYYCRGFRIIKIL